MQYDIQSLKRKMLVKYPFFGSVVSEVEYKEKSDISTAATDGEVIYYNPKFLEGLSVEEQTFIFAHEVCHIAFNHILRSEGKDQKIWNIATDAVINAFLKKDGLKMVEGGVDIKDAIDYDAEELYNKMLNNKNNNQTQSGNSGQGHNASDNSNNSNGNSSSDKQNNTTEEQNNDLNSDTTDKSKNDVGHDTHSMWEDAVKKSKEKRSNNNLEDKKEECEKLGEKDAFKKNREEKKKELEKLKDTLAKQVMQAGSSTNRDILNVKDIGTSAPLIDWRYVLKEAVKYDVDWSYKNAYIEDGVLTASLEEQSTPETEIVLDTSGSINETLLKNFLRECKNILQHSKVKVGCFDTQFYGFHEIRNEQDIENMKFEGGGGTDFDVAVKAFSKRVENKIIFTDGYAPMPQESTDAIWVVFGGYKINPLGGRVIEISQEQLERLHSYPSTSKYRR